MPFRFRRSWPKEIQDHLDGLKRLGHDLAKEKRLAILKIYFIRALAEHGHNGTAFDCDVLDAIKKLEEKYKCK